VIHVVDYGVGNVQAFLNVFKRLGIEATRALKVEDLRYATKLVLPGVGAFDHAMLRLNQSGMRPELERAVLDRQVPVLGVCVGMQMLAAGSDEGNLPGLNWIPGRVRSFASNPASASLPMPHMGWNDVRPCTTGRLFSGLESGAQFYFLHSFYFECVSPADVAARARYGFDFECAVSRGHIHGIQCHPEKSHRFGAQLLKNFAQG
jgi:glutamine amidotransferase